MNDKQYDQIEEARIVLEMIGMDAERSNERSALVFLALLKLRAGESWANATNPMLGTRSIMDFIRDVYGRNYAANTRETVRRLTLHQFVQAYLVVENDDQRRRPVNSPKWNYRITPEALTLIRMYGTDQFDSALAGYLIQKPGLQALYAAERAMDRIPVTLPDDFQLTLSPGGQNILLAAIIEEFCPRFTPNGEVLYIGDASEKRALLKEDSLATLNITVDRHGKMPDLIIHMPDKNWLVLLEAASSHGPVDSKRLEELKILFSHSSAGLVFVSCFFDRAEFRKYATTIAWETEVWCAENPSHMVHFNGLRFLGPYD